MLSLSVLIAVLTIYFLFYNFVCIKEFEYRNP